MPNASWQELRERNEERCRRLLERTELVASDDLDWDRIGATPIDDETLRCLVYMRDVENFTHRDFSGFSLHPATWGDPLVREFLDCWRTEEQEHAAVLGRFLDAYRDTSGATVPAPQPVAQPTLTRREKLGVALTRPVGHVVTAAHMTWGATNELLALNAYRLLAEQTDHPDLAKLLPRIASQESRHFSFYVLQAEWRLAASRLARFAICQMLRRLWTPVGVGGEFKQPEEFAAVVRHLRRAPAGDRVGERMDLRIAALPGLADIEIYRKVMSTGIAA